MVKTFTVSGTGSDGRPTVHDVAAAAGVSIATVSRVINEPQRVAAATRERVEAAMATLGYVLNTAGRSLAGGATGNVGVLMFVPPGSAPSDIFFMEMLRGVELALQGTGLATLVSLIPCDTDEEPRSRSLPLDRVDGLLLSGEPVPASYRRAIRRSGLPVVQMWHDPRAAGIWSVATDSCRAAEEVIGHLFGLGRRRIAHIGGPEEISTSVAKRQGYCQAHERAGIAVDPALHDAGRSLHTRDRGVAGVGRLLAAGILFDAIFADDDLIALGAMHALEQAGLRVPDDVAVAGYGDVEDARFARPPLTTARADLQQVGWLAASVLAKVLAGQAPPAARINVAPSLVVRASTAPDLADASRGSIDQHRQGGTRSDGAGR